VSSYELYRLTEFAANTIIYQYACLVKMLKNSIYVNAQL